MSRLAEVAFIDPAVENVAFFAARLRPGIEAIVLDPTEPALAQMARAVAGRRDIDAIHVIAHGRAGEVVFAAGTLSLEHLETHADELTVIGRALSAGGDLRLWVCEAARGQRGAAFIEGLGRLCAAPVSASTGLVGGAAFGGHWELDVRTGPPPPPPLTSAGVAGFAGVLATFTATAGTDTFNATTANDTFVVATGTVSALDTFNAGGSPGVDVIQIGVAGAGTSVDLSAAATDGVNGFVSIEALTFVNTSGTSTATFNAAQFGAGKIATAAAITGTASTQAIAVNVSANGSLDLSNWTFNTWASGTDTITLTGSTGNETITGSSQIDRFVVGATNQVSAADRYSGGAGNDILQIGVAGAGTSVDLSAAASDGVNGFVSIEALAFVNTSGTSTATFNAAQFGAGKIAATAAVTGTASTQAIVVNLSANGSLDLSGWTFTTWTSGTDTITVNGSTGGETITGAIQGTTILAGAGADTLIVGNTTQVQVSDRYDGGLDTDVLQIGVVGAGTSIDLSSAANNGVDGFVNIEALTFVNTSGTSTATFNAAQFGAGKIAATAAVTGTASTQAIAVNLSANGSLDLSGWTFTTWASGTDTITLTGSTGNETITGSSQIDTFSGAAGADVMTGGGGIDIFNFAAGGSALTFPGAGTAGTVSGYDLVTDFTPGQTLAAQSEKLGFTAAAVVANTAGATGTASTLQLNTAATVKSHAITNGIIRFDDATTFVGAVNLTTDGDVAAVAQYLQNTDIGNAGSGVAFVATIAATGVTHTYIYIQGAAAAGLTNVLIDLVNVVATTLAVTGAQFYVLDGAAPSAPTAPSVAEIGSGGINAVEASDGTAVVVSLSGTNAVAGDTVTVTWGGQAATRVLTGADILAGSTTVTVPVGTITTQGNGTFNVTARITDVAGNAGANSPATSVTVDTVAPSAPSAPSVAENSSGGINAVEASDGTAVVVSLSGTNAVAGDAVTVTWGGQAVTYTLVADDITGGSATVTVPVGTITTQGNGTFNVKARITDVAGNAGANSPATSVTVDTVAPTLSVDIVDGSLSDGDSSSEVTFTFSEAPVGFTAGDISATHGTVTALAATADPLVYTATFTADDGFTGSGTVSVASGSYTDAALNLGGSGSDSVTIDRTNPGLTIDGDLTLSIADTSINAAERVAVGFTTSGIDADVTVATVTFTDSAAHTVTVAASSGVANFSSFVSGPVSSILNVTDADGNIASAAGAVIALDANNGSNGNDTIIGTDADDIFNGLGGNDTIDGGVGYDRLDGGAGADTMSGGLGDDTYYVDDLLDVVNENVGAGVDLVYAQVDYTLGANVENLILTGSASIGGFGNELANSLEGNSGDNALVGGDGSDVLIGGAGADSLSGGADADYLLSDVADTVIAGGTGFDSVFVQTNAAVTLDLGTASIEWVRGNAGADTFNAASQTGAVYIYGQGGADTLTGSAFGDYFDGGEGDDTLVGGDGNDTLLGNTGADIMLGQGGDDYLIELAGDSQIDGGAGFDSLFVWSDAGVTLDLATASIEWVQGSALGDDALDSTGNIVNTFLYGRGGADILTGGSGDDYIVGGIGNDILIGGVGNDTLTGDAGTDRYAYTTTAWGADTIFSFDPNGEVLDFTAVAAIHSFADFTTYEWDPGSLGLTSTTLFYTNSGTASAITLIGVQVASLSNADFLFA